VYVTDRDRRIVLWSRGAERISGYPSAEVLGRRCSDNILIHVDDHGAPLCLGRCPLADTLLDGETRGAEVHLHHRDGHRVPVRVRVSPILDAADRIVGAVEVFSPHGAHLAALQRIEELEALAYLDALTGVGNRRYTEQTLQARLEELRRYGWSFAVLFIDIDNFKELNDAHGHDVGDAVLRMVARTLAGSLRSFDFLGRWGGEEFLAVVPMQLEAQLAPLAGRCRALVESAVLEHGSAPVRVTVSIGATIAGANDTLDGLVARADGLMYRSKAEGRNRVTLSPPKPAGRSG
jgi:diguanylate cyclase (GGDEF)-like protein/PAS domain S-box-containing protein